MQVLKSKRGLDILFMPMKSDIVDVKYFVNLGAVDEDIKDQGYCHALEHMLYAGTESRTWLDIVRGWEKTGTYYNAATWHDDTRYQINCLKRHWEDSFEILADIFYNPTFPVERWEEVEKGTIISEIQGEWDIPSVALAENMFQNGLGKGYHPVWGNIANIKKATIPDLKRFYNTYYCGKNITLSIAGDLTKAEVLRVVNKFDLFSDRKAPVRKKFNFSFKHSLIRLQLADIEQSIIHILKPVQIPRTYRGIMAVDVACDCFSQYLFEELRDKNGLVYDAGADLFWNIPGYLYIAGSLATDRDRLSATRKVLTRILKDFIPEGLTTSRVHNAIVSQQYNFACRAEHTDSVTNELWDAWRHGIRSNPFEMNINTLESLDYRTVKREAERALLGPWKAGRLRGK